MARRWTTGWAPMLVMAWVKASAQATAKVPATQGAKVVTGRAVVMEMAHDKSDRTGAGGSWHRHYRRLLLGALRVGGAIVRWCLAAPVGRTRGDRDRAGVFRVLVLDAMNRRRRRSADATWASEARSKSAVAACTPSDIREGLASEAPAESTDADASHEEDSIDGGGSTRGR